MLAEVTPLRVVLDRIGKQFAELIDKNRTDAYKFLRRELALNMGALVAADEIGNLKEFVMALQKVEDGMGENQSLDTDYPLDKIAKMLNENA